MPLAVSAVFSAKIGARRRSITRVDEILIINWLNVWYERVIKTARTSPVLLRKGA